jgi:cbb3-type cytochrome oxidase maturation protein
VTILYFLIPIALLLAGFFLFGFIWAVKKGQYEDLDTPSHRMLLEEDEAKPKNQP